MSDPQAADLMTTVLSRMLRTVLPAATIPPLLFTLVFCVWLWSFWQNRPALTQSLQWAMLACGVLCLAGTVLGAGLLLYHVWLGTKVTEAADVDAAGDGRRRLIKHAGFHATLLVLNLPVVFLLGTVAVGLTDRTIVEIDNRSTANLLELTLTDDTGDHPLGEVLAASRRTLRVKPSSDFTLRGVLGEVATPLGRFRLPSDGPLRQRVVIAADRTVEPPAENERPPADGSTTAKP